MQGFDLIRESREYDRVEESYERLSQALAGRTSADRSWRRQSRDTFILHLRRITQYPPV